MRFARLVDAHSFHLRRPPCLQSGDKLPSPRFPYGTPMAIGIGYTYPAVPACHYRQRQDDRQATVVMP
ncbi:MAG TPA: hypothetical protein VKZ54_08175 [Membranihabitans sp.]|nr:hypothetical protein [Membranihabitans sp.]